MKSVKFYILIIILGSLVYFNLEPNISVNNESVVTSETEGKDSKIDETIYQALIDDKYDERELKGFYSKFRGAEIWCSDYDCLGANSIQDIFTRLKTLDETINIKVGTEFDSYLESVFSKYKEDDGTEEALINAKSGIQNDMSVIAETIEYIILEKYSE